MSSDALAKDVFAGAISSHGADETLQQDVQGRCSRRIISSKNVRFLVGILETHPRPPSLQAFARYAMCPF